MKNIFNFTEPKLCKGKKPVHIPKGSNLNIEWAKNDWYINFSYNGRQYRIKEGINRIKDHVEKEAQAELLLKSIKNALKNGYDPENPVSFEALVQKEKMTLAEAVEKYLLELKTYARPKTVGSYQSKLRYLMEAFPGKEVRSFTPRDLEQYIHGKIHSDKPAKLFLNNRSIELKKAIPWTPKTVKSAKGVFSAFFQWCIANELFVGDNPVSKIESKKIRSEIAPKDRHIPFSQEDISRLMGYLNENDKTVAFFCRVIYSTCLRPGEIANLKVKDLDINRGKITIPLDTTKNTKKNTVDIIDIEPNLLKELRALFTEDYPKDYFLTSTSDSIIGAQSVGSNNAYKRFIKALSALGLDKKGYTLYSFKHFSNIQRFRSGWTLNELMVANRHSSLIMTEKYLKNINRDTDISKKEVPAI